MSELIKPTAFGCRRCNKIDWFDDREQKAQPEHVSHRGIDIGSCDGEMEKLYDEQTLIAHIKKADELLGRASGWIQAMTDEVNQTERYATLIADIIAHLGTPNKENR